MGAPTHNPDAAPPQRLLTPVRLFFVVCLLHNVWAATVGWNNTILDCEPFRQTDTAISAQYMVGAAPKLAYDMPLCGPPWSTPMEFPTYQWIVAGLASALGTPLDPTGRFVSYAFFLACLIPAYVVLRMLRFGGEPSLLILSLWLLSPYYAFWSRTFLIESTVLCLCLCFLAFTLAYCRRPSWWSATAALLFGVLAGLTKVTTFGPFLLAVSLLAGLAAVCRYRGRPFLFELTWRKACVLAVIVGVPVLCTAWWTRYADAVKELNAFGHYATSTALWTWNFGTLQQRLAFDRWAGHFSLMLWSAVGHWVLFLGSLVGLCFARRRWLEYGACLLLYISAPLVFTNLHFVHQYYSYANDVFVIAAVGIGLAAVMEKGGVYRKLVLCSLPLFLAVGVYRHYQFYYPIQSNNRYPVAEVCAAVERGTDPDDVLVVVGAPWCGDIPYYSKRRACVVPVPGAAGADCIKDPGAEVWHCRIGALIVRPCPGDKIDEDLVRMAITTAGLDPTGSRISSPDGDYTVYWRRPPREVADRTR